MLIKIIALGLTGTFFALILKKHNKELLPLMEIALLVAAVPLIWNSIAEQLSGLKDVFSLYSGDEELFYCIFRVP